jgi:hypothetical protein
MVLSKLSDQSEVSRQERILINDDCVIARSDYVQERCIAILSFPDNELMNCYGE